MEVRIAKTAAAAAGALLGGLHAAPAAAVALGQADTLEAGSTNGWSTGAGLPGPFVAASLGIDNVTAVSEPANARLLAGLAGIGLFGRCGRSA